MKKIIALSFAVAVAFSTASAQQTRETKSHKDHKMGQEHDGKMMKDRNLTDAQKQAMKAHKDAMKVKMDAIKNDPNLSAEQKRQQITALKQEQMESRKADLKGKRGKMAHRKGTMNAEHMDKMKENMGLTNDQAAQLKALNLQTRDKVQAIRNNNSLTQEQKQAQVKAVKEATKAQHQAILTKEQQQKMKSMKSEHKGRHDKIRSDRKINNKQPRTT